MSEIMNIYKYPHSVLRKKATEVKNIDGDTQDLINCMAETMYSASGIGLAANQVGELKRIIMYDITPKDRGRNLTVLINPEIVASEGEMIHEEACLSVIDFSAEVKRSALVRVKGFDRDGNPVVIDAENSLLAVCLQHEIDHLNGILFIDHISHLKRSLYKRKLKKILENNKGKYNP